ncbi:hypothetical protein GOBAR_DD02529 [Gossypium barbadense]|nr:hypothetical protein GOBAR_DD02529 [Gossypium barbadense]
MPNQPWSPGHAPALHVHVLSGDDCPMGHTAPKNIANLTKETYSSLKKSGNGQWSPTMTSNMTQKKNITRNRHLIVLAVHAHDHVHQDIEILTGGASHRIFEEGYAQCHVLPRTWLLKIHRAKSS